MEFVTRIVVASLQPDHSILRLVLPSLDRPFALPREISGKCGARVARAPEKDVQYRLDHLTVSMSGADTRMLASGQVAVCVLRYWLQYGCDSNFIAQFSNANAQAFRQLFPQMIDRTYYEKMYSVWEIGQ